MVAPGGGGRECWFRISLVTARLDDGSSLLPLALRLWQYCVDVHEAEHSESLHIMGQAVWGGVNGQAGGHRGWGQTWVMGQVEGQGVMGQGAGMG